MLRYLIAVGSSHVRAEHYLNETLHHLTRSSSINFVATSRIYQNASAHTMHNTLFHNCVVAVTTSLPPQCFYRELVAIEHRLGRIRSFPNAPRTIDLDVVLSLDVRYASEKFYVPHLQARERNFFVIPAIEAVKFAGWPRAHDLFSSSLRFGSGHLRPTSPIFSREA